MGLQSHAVALKSVYNVIEGNTYSSMVSKFSSTTSLSNFKS